jgi:hypothetical protein
MSYSERTVVLCNHGDSYNFIDLLNLDEITEKQIQFLEKLNPSYEPDLAISFLYFYVGGMCDLNILSILQ